MKFEKATKKKAKLRLMLMAPSGGGKAQPLDAKVLTPIGWRLMGELRAGDSVIGSDGRPCVVLGVYPQGRREVHRVTFSDGSWTECCDDHLWVTQTVLDRAAKRQGTPKSLREIRTHLFDKHGKRNHWIPMIQPVHFDGLGSRPLDPYLLGVLLGDGHFAECFVLLSNPEPEIQDAVAELLPSGVALREQGSTPRKDFGLRRTASSGPNPVVDASRSLGLCGKRSVEKFIPNAYLFSPVADRVALLQGLCDTDGYASGHKLEFSTSSPQLAEDVRFLVESLGGTTRINSRIPSYTYKSEKRLGAPSYRLNLAIPANVRPFRLRRKAEAFSPPTKYQPHRCIDSIESVGTKECQCISVSAADQLYATDQCILTHNTYTALRIAQEFGGRVAVIDTEHESASKYADEFEFDALNLDEPTIPNYQSAIMLAVSSGYDVVIVDSLSHAWQFALSEVDRVTTAQKTGNSFTAWGQVTPKWDALLRTVISCGAHMICTARSKTEYVLEENDRGKKVPRKVGMAPQLRDGAEYEFDVVGDMDIQNNLIVQKTRCKELVGKVFEKPGPEFAAILKAWLNAGADPSTDVAARMIQEIAPGKEDKFVAWLTDGKASSLDDVLRSEKYATRFLELIELRRGDLPAWEKQVVA